jgi:hypothetical protein
MKTKCGEVLVWPPTSGVRVIDVKCGCGFKGGIYTRPGAPPGYIHCPKAGCDRIITVAGDSATVTEVVV